MGAGGAITVADKKLVKRYGSIEKGKKYQSDVKKYESNRISQIKTVESQITLAKSNLLSKDKAFRKGQQAKVNELNKLLSELKSGTSYENVSTVINQVETFSKEVERVEKKNIRIRERNKKARRESKKQTITQTEIKPEIISYAKDATIRTVQPGQPVYADLDDINAGKQAVYLDVEKTKPVVIQKTYKKKAYVATPDVPVFLAKRNSAPVAPVIKSGAIESEIISMNAKSKQEKLNNVRVSNVNKIRRYIGIEEAKDIVNKRNRAIAISKKLNIEYKESLLTKKYYDNISSEIKSIESPSLKEIQDAGDQRGTFGTILDLGEVDSLSGKNISYATSKKLQEMIQKDYEKSYAAEKKSLEQSINKKEFQKRIEAGENYEKVNAEYQNKVDSANQKLNNYILEYEKIRGPVIRKQYQRIQADTDLIGKTKDVQSKIPGFFGTGVAVGAGTAVVTTAAIAVAPVIIPAVTGIGLVAGGAVTGIAIGKAIATGEDVYESSLDIGFTKKESIYRGLLGGSTDISPFLTVSSGALVGGVVVGGTLRAARKPIVERKAVSTNRPDTKVSGSIIKQHKITQPDGSVKKYITYPKQKIAEYNIDGSRAEATTKWRSIVKAKPVSTGYPSDTKGQARAIKLLREYGSTKADAKLQLQFIKPQIIEQTIVSGRVSGEGKIVKGVSLFKESHLVTNIDKAHGVKSAPGEDIFIKKTITRVGETNAKGYTNFVEVAKTDVGFQSNVGKYKVTFTKDPTLELKFGTAKTGKSYNTLYKTSTTHKGATSISHEAAIKQTSSMAISRTDTSPKIISSKGKTYLIGEPKDSSVGHIIKTHSIGKSAASQKHYKIYDTNIKPKVKLPSTKTYKQILDKGGDTKLVTRNVLTQENIQISKPVVTAQVKTLPLLGKYYNLAYLGGMTNLGIATAAITTNTVSLKLDPIQKSELSLVQVSKLQQTIPRTSLTENQIESIDNKDNGNKTEIEIQEPEPPMTFRYQQPPIIIGIGFGGKQTTPQTSVPLYQGQVLVKGKYKTVTTKPRPRSATLDAISRIIDNTTSAQGRIVPTGKKVLKSKARKGDEYYKKNKTKFRSFKIVNGRQVNQKNIIIEKRNKRMDTPGEVSGITVAQFTSRSRKKSAGLPTRQSHKKKKKSTFRL